MVEFEERTYTTADGTELPLRVWQPPEQAPPDAEADAGAGASAAGAAPSALVYLHGIQSHSRWYDGSSRRLAEDARTTVYQLERRGSGIDKVHEPGHVERAEVWLEDVAAAAELARSETGADRVHLLGVSWGGKQALACAGHRPDLYRSLIMGAPGIIPQVDFALVNKLRVAKALAAGRATERFDIPLQDPGLFTGVPEKQRYIAEDPLSLREVTAGFLYESRRLDGMARRAARRVRTPTLLCLAGHERVIDNAATRRLISRMPADRLKILYYPDGHHTLEFDPDPEPYWRDLVRWVRQIDGR